MATRQPPAGTALLTVLEAAAEMRCSDQHIYRLIADGDLSAVDISRKSTPLPKIRIRRDELTAYIKRQTSNARRLRTTA